MIQPLHSKSPSFIGDKKNINLSWKEVQKTSTPSNITAAGYVANPSPNCTSPLLHIQSIFTLNLNLQLSWHSYFMFSLEANVLLPLMVQATILLRRGGEVGECKANLAIEHLKVEHMEAEAAE